MRVTILNHFFHPDEAATSQLCSQLGFFLAENTSWNIHALCGRTRYALRTPEPAGLRTVRGVQIRRLWCTDFGTGSTLGRLCDYATFFAHAWLHLTFGPRPDVLIVMTSPPLISLLGAWTNRVRGTRFIYWVQDLYPEIVRAGKKGPPGPVHRILQKLAGWIDSRAETHVVLGSCMRDRILERPMARHPRIEIIPNWSPAAVPEPVPSDAGARFRQQHGLTGKKILMYSGNLGRAHDWKTMAEGFEILHARDPDTHLVAIGYGAGMRALSAWHADRPHLPVLFLGHQPQSALFDTLSSADIHVISQKPAFDGLVVPSKFYGIVPTGRPILFIGDRANSVAQTVAGFSLGSIIPPGDTAHFAAEAERILGSEMFRTTCHQQSRQWHETRGEPRISLALWKRLLEPEGGKRDGI
ncbi:MAG: glycosyltransferase family 4 protein [Verrucomicrobiae bacterium]|nr:glycosyltransferase family 4 protein [Verrucomicrobiae bacterium]